MPLALRQYLYRTILFILTTMLFSYTRAKVVTLTLKHTQCAVYLSLLWARRKFRSNAHTSWWGHDLLLPTSGITPRCRSPIGSALEGVLFILKFFQLYIVGQIFTFCVAFPQPTTTEIPTENMPRTQENVSIAAFAFGLREGFHIN